MTIFATILIVLLIISILFNIFGFFWLRNMKDLLVYVVTKKTEIDKAIKTYGELIELIEKKDIYLNDPNFKQLVYASYKLREYLNNSYKKIYDTLDFQIIEEENES